jgi:hypothetical protein
METKVKKVKPILLQFNDKVRVIRYDNRNLQIQEYRKYVVKKKDVWKWTADGFYSTMRSALTGICKKQLLSKDIKNIDDTVNLIDMLSKKLNTIDVLNLEKLIYAYNKIDSLELIINRMEKKNATSKS